MSFCFSPDDVRRNYCMPNFVFPCHGLIVEQGDPHMMGLRGQTFDWAGTDGEWYSMLSDGPELQLNVRVTAPQPDFPDRQLLTAVSLIFGGGSKHSLVIEVVDPHTIDNEKKCSILTDDNGGGFGVGNTLNGNGFRSEGSCLANGALRILVDGQEYPALSSPTAGVTLPDGDTVVSAMNLPAECQPFGGDKVWAEKFDHITPRARHSRRRRSLRGERSSTASAEAETFPFEEWILRSVTLAAPEWCAKFLEEEGVDGLLKVDSTHAVFRVDGPAITLRINIGTNHQDYLVLPDGKSVPEVDFWQVNVGVEAGAFSSDIAGMLGETSRVVLGVGGKPVMRGLKVLRGPVESYRVSGPLGVDFEQLHRSF